MAHDTGLIITGHCVDDGSDRSLVVLYNRKANAPIVVKWWAESESSTMDSSKAPVFSVSKTLKQIRPF